VQLHEYWPNQLVPGPKTITALLYDLQDLTKPKEWGWSAINCFFDLPEQDRGTRFFLARKFKLNALVVSNSRMSMLYPLSLKWSIHTATVQSAWLPAASCYLPATPTKGTAAKQVSPLLHHSAHPIHGCLPVKALLIFSSAFLAIRLA